MRLLLFRCRRHRRLGRRTAKMILDHIRNENRELLLFRNSKVQPSGARSSGHNSSLSRLANDLAKRRQRVHNHRIGQIRWPTHARKTWSAIRFYASSVNLDFSLRASMTSTTCNSVSNRRKQGATLASRYTSGYARSVQSRGTANVPASEPFKTKHSTPRTQRDLRMGKCFPQRG